MRSKTLDPKNVNKQIASMLKEHFQCHILIGFTLEGAAIRYCDYETDVQSHALDSAMRTELNENTQAPEVWVRNIAEI